MLEKLNKIPWSSLKHAYGFADDVPDQIRGLASADAEIRESVLWSLYGNIFHQGTRYQATPYAIPFIYELIENEEVQDRHKLIFFLVHIALGYEEAYLPEGVNFSVLQLEYEAAEENMTSEQRLENKKYGYSPMAVLNCYYEVEKGVSILQQLIKEEDKLIHNAAIYALAWFPRQANASVKLIQAQIPVLTEEQDIANAILTIGLLIRSSSVEIGTQKLEGYLYSTSKLIRLCAAIALAREPLSNQIVEILIDALLSDEKKELTEGIHFNEGYLDGYVSKTLSKYGEVQKERIVLALCELLKSVNDYQSLDVTQSIIDFINRNRVLPIKETKLEDLEELDIVALRTIANFGGWEGFGNYSLMMHDAGMPGSKETLLEYLELES